MVTAGELSTLYMAEGTTEGELVMPSKDDFLPTRFPFPPIPKGIMKKMAVKVVTVPGGSKWRCSGCGRELRAGEQVVKMGKIRLCQECTRGLK